MQARQRRNDVLGDTVRKELLFGVAAHIRKWQDGDGWFVECRLLRFDARLSGHDDRIHPNRLCDVLHLLLALIPVVEIELANDLFVYVSRNTNTAWSSKRFETGSDVNAVAQNIRAVYDNVAEIDADAISDPRVFADVGFAR